MTTTMEAKKLRLSCDETGLSAEIDSVASRSKEGSDFLNCELARFDKAEGMQGLIGRKSELGTQVFTCVTLRNSHWHYKNSRAR